MRRLLLFVLLLIFFQVSAQTVTKHPYRVIRTLTADLNNDGKTDSINLISSLEGRNDFNRISISLTGVGKTVFNAKDYWTAIDSDFLAQNKNLIKTKLIFAKKTSRHAAVLLFGVLDAAGYRGEFSIINIENNKVIMSFDEMGEGQGQDIEAPIELTDLEHNGRLCFVFTTLHEFVGSSQANGKPDIGSYTPYLVYPVADRCELDKSLSKEYMDKNYVFAGFKYSEKILIRYPQKKGERYMVWKKRYFN